MFRKIPVHMVRIIENPRIIPAVGTPTKKIEEYIGKTVSGTSEVSIARMISPPGWSEPFQTPEFDEYTLVLEGTLMIESEGVTIKVSSGQAVIVQKGSKIRYKTPEGAEYIAVCLPAFSSDIVHRMPESIDTETIHKSVENSYYIHEAGPDKIDRIENLWKMLHESIIPLNPQFSKQMQKNRFADRKQDLIEKNSDRIIRIFFAIDNDTGKDVGYCISSVAADSFGEIESIFILEEVRNKGIGTMLMIHAISWMKEQNVSDIRVEVTFGNEEVMRFYRKFGLFPRKYVLTNPGEV